LKKKFLRLILAHSFFCSSFGLIAAEKIDFNSAASIFLNKNASVLKSKAAILSYQALQARADSLSEPKFTLISYVAPIFEAKGDALSVTRDYSKWGPIIGADAEVIWPLYSFGNITKLEEAAFSARTAGEAIAKSEINSHLYDFKEIYLGLVMLKRLKPVLDEADSTIKKVLKEAQQRYQQGDGEIQQRDVARIQVFAAEVEKYLSEWRTRKSQGELALGHLLGRTVPVKIIEEDFPELELEGAGFKLLVDRMWETNPDWQAISEGLRAREGQLDAAENSGLPVFFIGGRASAAATAMRTNQDSSFAQDPYNIISAEVGFGFRWKWPGSEEESEVLNAKAEVEKLQAQKAEAKSGLPLQVFIAKQDLDHADNLWTLSATKLKAASRWSISELTAFETGVGEPKNLLEGFAASLLAEKEVIEAQYKYCLAWAKLAAAVGDQAALSAWEASLAME
jgi:outer membrane protein TolC